MTAASGVAVVTGGTHGIGRHAVELLAGAGWSVALCSRNGSEAELVAKQLREAHGVPALGVAADVGVEADVRSFAARVVGELGPPTALLAGAGVLGPVGPIHEVDLHAWATTVGVDLIGVAHTVAVFGAVMVEHGGGSIVTMSGGGVGGPSMATQVSAYTCSKAAVVAFTEAVAAELAPHGVRVNAIAPGAIATRFMDAVIEGGPELSGQALYEQTLAQRAAPDSLDGFDSLLTLLVDPEGPSLTGRALSARWDDPAMLRSRPPDPESSVFRLRRIDDGLFGELSRGQA